MAMITVYDEERPGLHVATAKESGRGYDLVQYGSETCCKSLGECMFISTRGRVLLRVLLHSCCLISSTSLNLSVLWLSMY